MRKLSLGKQEYSSAVCAKEMGTEKAFLHLRDSKNDVAFDVNVRMMLLAH